MRLAQMILWMGFLITYVMGNQEDPAVIRTEGLTVVVDAVVTDSRNRVVPDLTADDFLVYEDGVLQELDSVVFGRSPAGAAAEGDEPSVEAPREPGLPFGVAGLQPRGNLIVFLLDYATTDHINQNLVQEAAIRYVRGNLRENDFVAVFGLGAGFGLLQDFTNNPNLLVSALQIREVSGRSLAAAGDAGPPVPAGAAEAVSAAAGPVDITAATAQAAQTEQSELARLAVALRIQRAFYTMGSFVQEREARSVLTAIRAIAQGLEPIEGRKTLVLFSQGFVVGPHVERALEQTVSVANRANLAVYAIDSQGLVVRDSAPGEELYSIGATQGSGSALTGRRIDAVGGQSLFDRAKEVGSDARDSALRFVSASTGGFAIRNTNDLHVGLERIDQDIRSYYLLVYRPNNQAFDGTFRDIRVDLKEGRHTVRHRSGYLAMPPGWEVLSAEEYRLVRSAERGEVSSDLPAYLRLETFSRDEELRDVLVSLEVMGAGLEFSLRETDLETLREIDIEVAGVIRDATGAALIRFGTPMSFQFTDEEHEVLVRDGGLSFNNRVELPPGIYSVLLLVRDVKSGRVALQERALRVPEPGSGLELSSIVLGKEVQRSDPEVELLTVGNSTVLPSAGRRFRNGDHLVYYFEIYNAAPGSRLSAELAVYRAGSSQPVRLPAIQMDAPAHDRKLALSRYVELAGLAPGPYFLEATVSEPASGREARGRTPFVVISD